jgi:hypothetical protein
MSDPGPGRQAGGRPRPSAVRLIFEYEGDDVRLVSSQAVDMVVPPGDPVAADTTPPGVLAEVRQADGTTLYRKSVGQLLRSDVEVFSDDPARSITRAPVDRPSGTFVLVIPDDEAADHLALVANSPEAGARMATRELLRVPLGSGAAGGAS